MRVDLLRALAGALLAVAATTGCLRREFELTGREVARIASLPPEQRGQRVRVVQRTAFQSDVFTEAPDPETLDCVFPEDCQVVVVSRSDGTSSGASIGAGSGGGDAEAAVVLAVAGLAIATTAMVVVAPVEGRRYDGWVRLPGDHPVMLIGPGGETSWRSLAALTPQDAALATRAIVLDEDGVARLGRAPLAREGMAYELEFTGAPVSVRDGLGPVGFGARAALGGFFSQTAGILFGGQFTATSDDGTAFNGRLFVNGEYYPVRLGRVHLGTSLEGGYGLVLHDAPAGTSRADGLTLGAHALVELDLSTRLGLVFRGGAALLPALDASGRDRDRGVLTPEFGVGLAVH